MLKFSLDRVDDKEFNIINDNVNLEFKIEDIELFRDDELFFYLKLNNSVFNLKLNKLLGLLEKELINLINENSFYFDSYINFEKIYKIVDGNIIFKVNKNGKNMDEIFYKDTKKIILKFNKLIIEEDKINGSIIKILINYELKKY